MKKLSFVDQEGNELIYHINSDNKLFILTGDPTDQFFNGYVCLDKEDVADLIISLKSILKEMA